MHKYVFPYPGRTNTPWKVDIPATMAGRRIRKFFTQRETAELAAIAILDELKRRGTEGARVNNQGPTVHQALDAYMQDKHVSPRYLEALKYHCSRMEAEWGPRAISSLDVLDGRALREAPDLGR